MVEDSAIKKTLGLPVDGRRSRGGQRLRITDVMRRNTEVAEVVEDVHRQ